MVPSPLWSISQLQVEQNAWFMSIQANAHCFGSQISSWSTSHFGFVPQRKYGKQDGNFFMQSTHIVIQLDLIGPKVAHIPTHVSCVLLTGFLRVSVMGTSDLLRMNSTTEATAQDCPLFSDPWLYI